MRGHDVDAVFANLGSLLASMVDSGPRAGADSGSPTTDHASLFEAGAVEAGTWRCTPGGWEIVDRPDTEIMLVLSGRARITTAGGDAQVVSKGDIFVLPRGWSGRWDVLETLEKLYVTIGSENR